MYKLKPCIGNVVKPHKSLNQLKFSFIIFFLLYPVNYLSSSTMAGSSDSAPASFIHTSSETGRLLSSATKCNSNEIDFDVSLPSPYSKSYLFELVITDKTHYRRFLYISLTLAFVVLALGLVLHFLPQNNRHHGHSKNLTLALNQAITFFDAQKCKNFPLWICCR